MRWGPVRTARKKYRQQENDSRGTKYFNVKGGASHTRVYSSLFFYVFILFGDMLWGILPAVHPPPCLLKSNWKTGIVKFQPYGELFLVLDHVCAFTIFFRFSNFLARHHTIHSSPSHTSQTSQMDQPCQRILYPYIRRMPQAQASQNYTEKCVV